MTRRSKTVERRLRRARRHARVQKRVRGSEGRPRLVVSRSLKHIEGQLVDDDRGITLLGVSTRGLEPAPTDEEEGEDGGRGRKVSLAYEAGRTLAERAREVGVERVVFDRAGYTYHGRVKAFADGAREGGLEF